MSSPSLAGTGFSWETPIVPPSIILSLEGLEKSGRTWLACQAPEPIAYQGLDTGEDTMETERAKGKKIASTIYHYPKFDPSAKGPVAEKQAEEIRRGVWDKFTKDYYTVIDRGFRTIIWDTATEVWELIRLANFGRLSQVPEIAYPDVNAEFKELIRTAKKANVNLMLIHQVKEERENKIQMTPQGPKEKSISTGRMIRAGMNKMGYLVDAYVLTRYIRPTFSKDKDRKMEAPGRFEVEVLEARHNKPLIGTVFESPNLLEMLSLLRPDIEVESWGLGELAGGVEVEL